MPNDRAHFLRVVEALAFATLAGCGTATAPATDGAADDRAMNDAAAMNDGPPPTCPSPRPPDLTPCTNPGYTCTVPSDPAPPDAHVTPSGGQCRCDNSSGSPVWQCFLAAGPQLPPELPA